MSEFIDVDPAELHLPPSRSQGGLTPANLPVRRPDALVPAEVIHNLPRLDVTRTPKVKEVLP